MQRKYRKPKPQKELIKKFRVNHQISVPEIFLIDENGSQIGVTQTAVALERALELELDLVEVSPLSNPPVAKIMNYGQYKYEIEKKLRKAKAHQKTTELKSLRLSFRIKGQDLETKKKQALDFLQEGNKVKIDTILRGREKIHKDLAVENIKKFIDSLKEEEDLKIIQNIAVQNGQISATISK